VALRGASGGSKHIIDTRIVESPTSVSGSRYYRAPADRHITIEGSNTILGSWTRTGDLSHMNTSNGTTDSKVVEGRCEGNAKHVYRQSSLIDDLDSGGFEPLTFCPEISLAVRAIPVAVKGADARRPLPVRRGQMTPVAVALIASAAAERAHSPKSNGCTSSSMRSGSPS
jgi:hypothetical protein